VPMDWISSESSSLSHVPHLDSLEMDGRIVDVGCMASKLQVLVEASIEGFLGASPVLSVGDVSIDAKVGCQDSNFCSHVDGEAVVLEDLSKVDPLQRGSQCDGVVDNTGDKVSLSLFSVEVGGGDDDLISNLPVNLVQNGDALSSLLGSGSQLGPDGSSSNGMGGPFSKIVDQQHLLAIRFLQQREDSAVDVSRWGKFVIGQDDSSATGQRKGIGSHL